MTTRGSASTAMTDLASNCAPDATHRLPGHALLHRPYRFASKSKLPKQTTKEKGISKCRLLLRIGVSIQGCCCARP